VFQDPSLFTRLLEALDQDPNQGALLVSIGARGNANPMMMKFAQLLAEFAATTTRPVIAYCATSLGGLLSSEAVEIFHRAGIPFLGGTDIGMNAMRLAHDYWDVRERLRKHGPPPSLSSRPDRSRDVKASGLLPFMEAKRMLDDFGIPIVATHLAQNVQEAASIATALGYPVVVKADAEGLSHRSDIGCVRVDCRTEHAVREAFTEVAANARKAGYNKLHGALIQPMMPFVAETFAGIKVDPVLGPAVVFGLGGIFVEIIRDVVIAMPPFDRDRAHEMIRSIKAARVLQGARGTKPADVDALASILVRLGDFAVAHRSRLKELDLNPILVRAAGEGVSVVDVLMEFGGNA
jgi:acetate---CoA ligase (ADP-forming)